MNSKSSTLIFERKYDTYTLVSITKTLKVNLNFKVLNIAHTLRNLKRVIIKSRYTRAKEQYGAWVQRSECGLENHSS